MKLLPPPGPERKRQLLMLGVLVVVLAIYFGRQYWPTAAPPATTSNQGAGTGAKPQEKVDLPDVVRLEELEPAPPSEQTARNPFQFGVPPPPPTPPAPPYVPPQPQVYQPPPPPPPPQVPLRCTGMAYVPATKQRTALMLDTETNNARWVVDGTVIDGRYKIVKVNAESVVVSFTDGTGQKTVFLEK